MSPLFVPKLIVCLKEGYTKAQFRADLGAGVVVGLVAVPLAMAFAIASGLPPERGLYTAIVAGFLISAFSGSRVQIGGPTGAFVVVVAGIVHRFGYEGLAMATLMAGVMLFVMGVTRLGDMIKYIPFPVTTGFTSGIAVVIFSSQMRDFLGLPLAEFPPEVWAQWKACFGALAHVNPSSLALAALTCILLAGWPRRWEKIPSPIVALALATGAAALFRLPVETIGTRFGGLPHGLPELSWPAWSWKSAGLLFPSAATIAFLGALESLLSAVVADGMIGTRHKSSTELIAQGLANIASPLFGGMPATGAIARTATNVRNGGRTPVAGMTHALVILVILLAAGPVAVNIPLAALAGILVVVCYRMAEWRSVLFILSGPWSDRIVMLTTFFLTIFVGLTAAVEAGVVMAALLFMRNIADLTQVRTMTGEHAGGTGDKPMTVAVPKDVDVYSIHGSFFFGAAHKIMEVGRFIHRAPRALILDLTAVLHMDASGLHVLEQIRKECSRRGTRLVLVGLHTQALAVMEQSDMAGRLGEGNLQPDLDSALGALAASQ